MQEMNDKSRRIQRRFLDLVNVDERNLPVLIEGDLNGGYPLEMWVPSLEMAQKEICHALFQMFAPDLIVDVVKANGKRIVHNGKLFREIVHQRRKRSRRQNVDKITIERLRFLAGWRSHLSDLDGIEIISQGAREFSDSFLKWFYAKPHEQAKIEPCGCAVGRETGGIMFCGNYVAGNRKLHEKCPHRKLVRRRKDRQRNRGKLERDLISFPDRFGVTFERGLENGHPAAISIRRRWGQMRLGTKEDLLEHAQNLASPRPNTQT